MLVKDLMTVNPVTVTPDSLLIDAARLMLDLRLSGLPVVDAAGTLVGIITEGDLLRRPELGTTGKPWPWLMAFLMPARSAGDYAHTHTRHVREAMSGTVVSASSDMELGTAVKLMLKHRIKRLPVIADGKLVGVISRSDLLRALAKQLTPPEGSNPGPEAIKAHIKATLAEQSWAPTTGIHIEVSGNSVILEGYVFNDEERKALRVVAENTPGVKYVQDQLRYIDPATGITFPPA